ncbi:MAG: molecular chaperone DnaK [Phycisphaerae bacterium]|nr:molecular chaperone DnaK [Phycisphaerae bacterium]
MDTPTDTPTDAPTETIIGIDLGTTNSAVAYMKDGESVIVPNMEGDALTPSVVAFAEDDRRWVGRIAKTQAVANPRRTIFSIKRRMGSTRTAREELLDVVSSIKRRMGTENVVTVGNRTYTPVEISAMILEKLKADTEAYLGKTIKRAVITVPAYFNDSQRRATREAGAVAGLEVVRLVNEPTAASLAYGLDIEKVHSILVWDLGGGTFDVSVLELGDGVFEVKAVNGNTKLGGDDYDQRLVEMLIERFRDEWDVDLNQDATAKRMTRQLAEQAKMRLTDDAETRVVLPAYLSEGRRCALTVTRDAFEQITADITERMVAPAECALSDAGIDPIALDRVVLVGGMTRVPAVRALVKRITGIDPYGHIDPDKVVALGAAIQAGVLAGQVHNVTLVDVTPLSLGIETKGELFTRIIHRNTPIPTTKSKLFTNAEDDQTVVEIHVLQGERELAPDNVTLDKFYLHDVEPQPRGEARLEVWFDIDANGMVHVSAVDLQQDTVKRIRIEAACQPPADVVERMLAQSQEKMESDQRKRQEIEAGIRGENLILATEKLVGDMGETPDEKVRQAAEAAEHGTAQVRDAMADGRLERITSANETLEAQVKKLDLAIKAAAAPIMAQEPVA